MRWLALILFLALPAHAETVSELNSRINRDVFYVTDQDNYGTPDLWAIAADKGDCEDIALRKWSELRRRGIDSRIGVYFDPEYGDYHAVLIVGGKILDGARPFWHKRKAYRAASERFVYIAEIRGRSVFVVEVGGRPVTPKRVRSIAPGV